MYGSERWKEERPSRFRWGGMPGSSLQLGTIRRTCQQDWKCQSLMENLDQRRADRHWSFGLSLNVGVCSSEPGRGSVGVEI